ncbi:MAG: hypothetical protein KAU20_02710 [Nanoarchaeota archaeon]|nr:hypothetical protein [Nanoarchaeota archaeon]
MFIIGFGILSLIMGMIALIALSIIFTVLLLPLTPTIYKRVLLSMIIPFVLTLLGIFFYFMQRKSFITKTAIVGVIINIITLIIEIYLLIVLMPLI